jgi:hydrogenase nickel incorporation protein HypA/HybF
MNPSNSRIMHELSIVMSIIDTAEEQVKKHQAQTVESIELEIGSLAGIEPSAFDFAWEAAIPRTVLAKAERVLNNIPAKAHCQTCLQDFEMKQLYQACPHCGNYRYELFQGQELKIKSLTLVNE